MSLSHIPIEITHAILQHANLISRGRIVELESLGQRRRIFYIQNPRCIIKLQAAENLFQTMQNEISTLQQMPQRSWIPRCLASGIIEGVGLYSIETIMPGLSLSRIWNNLSKNQQRKIGQRIGEITCDMHKAKTYTTCGDYLTSYDSAKDLLKNKFKTIRERLKDKLNEYLEVKKFLTSIESLIEYSTINDKVFVTIHNDIHIGNILCTEKRGIFKGIIDFEMSCRATPIFELLRLYYCTHWPRRFVHNDKVLKESYRDRRLDSLWEGAKETYPSLFCSIKENKNLVLLSLLYDLESLATAFEKGWQRSAVDNINRLKSTLTNYKLYDGEGWL